MWHWSEWPDQGNRTDTGVDIVAKLRDGDGLAAIQCKFYAADKRVSVSLCNMVHAPWSDLVTTLPA